MALQVNQDEVAAFADMNRTRIQNGLIPQYNHGRFRVLKVPTITSEGVGIEVAPFDYISFAVLRDENPKFEEFKESVSRRLAVIDQRSPFKAPRLRGFLKETLVPLGVEIVLITSDSKVLLRRRGHSVQTETRLWDVSASGYASISDVALARRDRLDLVQTVRTEVENEIGQVRGNPADITFTGFHVNEASGATDLLAYWKLADDSKAVSKLLSKHQHSDNIVFPTSVAASEQFVFDCENTFVTFQTSECLAAVRKIHEWNELFMPEALHSLILALEDLGV